MRQILSLIFAGLGVGLLLGQWLPGPLASYVPWRVRVKALCEGTCTDLPQTLRLGLATVRLTTQETPSLNTTSRERMIALTAVSVNQDQAERLLPRIKSWIDGWNMAHAAADNDHHSQEEAFDIETALKRRETLLQSPQDRLQTTLNLPVAIPSTVSPSAKALQAEQQTLASLTARYTEAHPLVVQSRSRLKILEKRAQRPQNLAATPMATQRVPVSLDISPLTHRLNTLEYRVSLMDQAQRRLSQSLYSPKESPRSVGKLVILTRVTTPLPSDQASKLGVAPGLLSLAAAIALLRRPKRLKKNASALPPIQPGVTGVSRLSPSVNDFVFSLKPRRHLIPAETLMQLADWLRAKARQSSGRSVLLLGLCHEDESLQPYGVGLLSRQIGLKWAERGLSTLLIDGPGVAVSDHSVRAPLAGFKSVDSGWQWWQYTGWNLLHGVSREPSHVQPWPTPPWPSAYAYTLLSAAQEGMGLEISSPALSSVGWPCEDVVIVASRRDQTRWATPIDARRLAQWQAWAQTQGLCLQGVIDVRLG